MPSMRCASEPHSAAAKPISWPTGIFSGGGSCGTKPTVASTCVRSRRGARPSIATAPSWVYSPSRQRISVVLPAPLEPIRATRSPSPMSRLMPSRTRLRLKVLETFSKRIMKGRIIRSAAACESPFTS